MCALGEDQKREGVKAVPSDELRCIAGTGVWVATRGRRRSVNRGLLTAKAMPACVKHLSKADGKKKLGIFWAAGHIKRSH